MGVMVGAVSKSPNSQNWVCVCMCMCVHVCVCECRLGGDLFSCTIPCISQARSKQFLGGAAPEMGVVNSLCVWFVYTLVTSLNLLQVEVA